MNATSFSERPSRPTPQSTAKIVLRTLVRSYRLVGIGSWPLSLTFNGAGQGQSSRHLRRKVSAQWEQGILRRHGMDAIGVLQILLLFNDDTHCIQTC
jgi:hypothetical protein